MCPNNKEHKWRLEHLVHRYVGFPGGNFNRKDLVDIRFIAEFEAFGTYETWGYGWEVSIDRELIARDVCLYCALEKLPNRMGFRE